MFTPLHSNINQDLFEKYICNQSTHYEKYDGAACPSYCRIHCSSLLAMSNSLHSSTNHKLFEKPLCNKSSHNGKSRWFPIHKGSHHVPPPNQPFSLSVKINGAQRRTLVSPWWMHWTYCSMPKGTSRAEATLNSENIKPVALAVIELH